jgi:hypothetical protein
MSSLSLHTPSISFSHIVLSAGRDHMSPGGRDGLKDSKKYSQVQDSHNDLLGVQEKGNVCFGKSDCKVELEP